MPEEQKPPIPSTSGDAKGTSQDNVSDAAGTNEKGIVDKIKESAGNMASSAGDAISSGMNYIKETVASDSQKATAELYEIGTPYGFTETVDPEGRARNLLMHRMNTVMILPCYYAQSYLYNDEKKKSIFKYGIGFQKAMEHYSKMFRDYVKNPTLNYTGVRIYLTEDASTTVGITNTYEDNFFQKAADALSSALSTFTKITSSVTSHGMNKGVEEIIGSLNTDNIIEEATNGLNVGEGTKDILGSAVDGLKQSASIILKGNKISLPKIWRSSDFTSSFTITTKLYSAYGKPRHIAGKIVAPILALLLLASPQSDDMVSYGKPFACYVLYPGNSKIKLACIKSLTIQRGGGDAGKNIYGQPLSINLSIEFGSLVDGFMAFASHNDEVKIPGSESAAYRLVAEGGQIIVDDAFTIDASKIATVTPTVGDVISSFIGGRKQKNVDDNIYDDGGLGGSRAVGQIGGAQHDGGGDFFGTFVDGLGLDGPYGNMMDSVMSQFDSVKNFVGDAMQNIDSVSRGVAGMVSKANGLINSVVGGQNPIMDIITDGPFKDSAVGKAVGNFQKSMNSQATQFMQTSTAAKSVLGASGRVTDFISGFF